MTANQGAEPGKEDEPMERGGKIDHGNQFLWCESEIFPAILCFECLVALSWWSFVEAIEPFGEVGAYPSGVVSEGQAILRYVYP